MLQCYADDSIGGTARKELVVAGYIQTVEAWEKFAEEWDAVLRADPPIAYLKMKEALPRGGQFKGFSEGARNRKIFALADVIERHAPWSLHVRVSVSQFRKRIRPVAPYPLHTHYFLTFFALVMGVANIHDQMGVSDRCKLIFDTQEGLPARVLPIFEEMFQEAPKGFRERIEGVPSFEDDKKFTPLQAADMLAWSIRRKEEGPFPRDFEGLWEKLFVKEGYYTHLNDEILDKFAADFRSLPTLKDIDKKVWRELMPIIAAGEGRS